MRLSMIGATEHDFVDGLNANADKYICQEPFIRFEGMETSMELQWYVCVTPRHRMLCGPRHGYADR